jgi:hypothetical protein
MADAEQVTISGSLPEHQQQSPPNPGAAPETQQPSVESLQKALADTKAELTRIQQAQKASVPDTTNPSGVAPVPQKTDANGTATPPNPLTIPEVAAAPKGAAIFEAIQAEIASGQVSEASEAAMIEALASVFGPDIAKNIFEQHKAVAALSEHQYAQSVMDVAGGDAQYGELAKWIGTNFSNDEKRLYNEAVSSRDPARAQSAVKGAMAMYRLENPQAPVLRQGLPSAAAGATGYATSRDMVVAMRDPRYHKEPAYRAEVERRIAASNFA